MAQRIIDFLGFGLCHQLPERTLMASGLQLPVCARDTGIYIGFMVAFFLIVALGDGRRSSPPPMWLNIVLGLGLASMVFDGATSYMGIRPTTNELRVATGLATGFAIAAWVMPLLSGQVWMRSAPGRVLGDTRRALLYLLGMGGAYVLIWWVLPLTGPAYALISVLAIVLTFTAINMVIVNLLPPFERRATRLVETIPALGIALVLTFVELWASAALKVWLIAAVPV